MFRLILALWALIMPTIVAHAQTQAIVYFLNANGGRTPVSVTDPLPTGSGFRIVSFGTPISVTTSNSTGTLPTGVPVVLATNVGSNTAYCALGASATTSSQYIPAGGSFPFLVTGSTQLTCITASSTTTINMTGGSGNAGSGSGGGGSGGSGTSSSFGAAFPGTGTAIGFTDDTNMVAARTGAVSNKATAVSLLDSLIIGQYLATPPTLTDTRYQHLLLDINGNVKVNVANATTAIGNDVDNVTATSGGNSPVVAYLSVFDGTNWDRLRVGTAGTATAQVHSIQGIASMTPVQVSQATAATLNATVVGTGTFAVQAAATLTAETTKVIGTVNVAAAQTIAVTNTSATAASVINGGSAYETVAASQTGQSLGATGGTGDYLSHCVIYPTTTTPGVVTVFDNSSAAGSNVIAFPGGASSVSNLAPISIPVGAISTAGAWKVTTGANLVVTCYGRFT